MNVAYIGVGGNLGNVAQTISSAIDQLKQNPNIHSVILSSLYESKPLQLLEATAKLDDQPLYINAVAQLDTHLTPHQLLCVLQKTELHFGRVRTQQQWSSRTLDLDILLFNDLQLSTEDLIIPHVGILERDFVLEPLFEIAPKLTIPAYGSVASALKSCENRGLKKL